MNAEWSDSGRVAFKQCCVGRFSFEAAQLVTEALCKHVHAVCATQPQVQQITANNLRVMANVGVDTHLLDEIVASAFIVDHQVNAVTHQLAEVGDMVGRRLAGK